MPVTKLVVEYFGTPFAGWAKQPGERTVEEEIERAIKTISGETVQMSVAGRTDKGVHAWSQVASYSGEPRPIPARRSRGPSRRRRVSSKRPPVASGASAVALSFGFIANSLSGRHSFEIRPRASGG